MGDFRARMNEVVTAFKKAHRGVRPTRFVLSEGESPGGSPGVVSSLFTMA